LAFLAPAAGPACTTFCLEGTGGLYFGKNYDFQIGGGLLVVNKRGVEKAARADASNPARWTSRYGSVTFNQYGREFPSGGMNEAGLVVELMWLEGARYPGRDRRPAVGVLEWIQFQLDNSATVEEVIASRKSIRIAGGVPLHYLVGDRTGRCAAVEFLGGEMVAHSGAAMPVPVLTNDTYERSIQFLRRHRGFGGTLEVPEHAGSLARFARAASLVREHARRPDAGVQEAFDVLASVAAPGYTQWSIVYDLRAMRVHFSTQHVPRRRELELAALDFRCATPVRVLDLAEPVAGDVSGRLVDYTPERNGKLIRASYGSVDFLRDTPPAELEALARHPDASRCSVPRPAR
jgi:choloylglycine hydrolase